MFRHRRNCEYEPIRDTNNYQELIEDTNDEPICKIYGYIDNSLHRFFYHLFGILFLGLPYLVIKICPQLGTIKYSNSALDKATILLAYDNHGQTTYITVKYENIKLPLSGRDIVNIRYFIYQHTKYVWISEQQRFATLDILVRPETVDDYLKNLNGLKENDYLNRLKLYGPNKIEVEIKTYWRLFVEEVFNPFYMFQAFSVILWLFDDYVSYALCVIALTLFSSITSLIQTRKQSEALHNLVESSKCHEVKVLRHNIHSENVEIIDPVDLVPGDLIILPSANFIMPCDAVLLTGQCIANESVLTGESVPITKTSLHSSTELYHPNTHKRHTLFSGTHILQTRYYEGEFVLARVVRTGFDTIKGALVKSILFPAPVGLKFYRDGFKFVLFLFCVAAVGMSYCLYLYITRHAELHRIIVRTLDIITIVVPPALPAAMAVGTVYSQNRLKKNKIFCISPPRIILGGKIKLACFDKTGTLTHDGLDMKCVLSSINAQFTDEQTDIQELDIDSPFVQAMATCHSLTRIDGVLNGDPLDLNMFEFTQWELEEGGGNENSRYDVLGPTVVKPPIRSFKKLSQEKYLDNPYQMGILHDFPFSSTLQCMSVICRDIENPNMVAFTKGAPEKIHNMCLPETIPLDFNLRLRHYTTQGYRVIAVAYKELPKNYSWKEVRKCKRDTIECDLHFLGLLILQNPLKNETSPVIEKLHEAAIRTVMITGDNILTAISVSRDCGMVKYNEKIFILSIDNCDNPDTAPSFILSEVGGASPNENVIVDIEASALYVTCWYMLLKMGYQVVIFSMNIEFLDIFRTTVKHLLIDSLKKFPNETDFKIIALPYHFAIDGRTWNKIRSLCPDVIPDLLVRTTIFARFQPDQKTQVVTYLQSLDYVVAMVGDGANDCGALKAAHLGVSLSQAEASVAAPFTSAVENISCLLHLILEGRCAIVTSFAIFKYMAMYSLIQFFTILILYRYHSILGDHQFLFIDLVITTILAVAIGRQGPSNMLGTKRPLSSLVAAKNVVPLILQIAACGLMQMGALYYLFLQDWFKPIPSDADKEIVLSWENTVLFTVSCYQYIILATVYSKGRPYRQMLITNFWFLVSAMGLTIFVIILMIQPSPFLAQLMEIMFLPHRAYVQINFRYTLLAFPVLHFILAFFIEVAIADREWLKRIIQCLTCKRGPKNKYKLLLMENNQFWHNIDNNRIVL